MVMFPIVDDYFYFYVYFNVDPELYYCFSIWWEPLFFANHLQIQIKGQQSPTSEHLFSAAIVPPGGFGDRVRFYMDHLLREIRSGGAGAFGVAFERALGWKKHPVKSWELI